MTLPWGLPNALDTFKPCCFFWFIYFLAAASNTAAENFQGLFLFPSLSVSKRCFWSSHLHSLALLPFPSEQGKQTRRNADENKQEGKDFFFKLFPACSSFFTHWCSSLEVLQREGWGKKRKKEKKKNPTPLWRRCEDYFRGVIRTETALFPSLKFHLQLEMHRQHINEAWCSLARWHPSHYPQEATLGQREQTFYFWAQVSLCSTRAFEWCG